LKPVKLTDIVNRSHTMLAEVLFPGDLAVDLTVGNGKDTIFLHKTVGRHGCVVGFDIQEKALQKAAGQLRLEGAHVDLYVEDPVPEFPAPGIHLILADHAGWSEYVSSPPRVIIANLGFLPGSDHGIVTQIPTTIAALEAGFERLTAGGRLAVVCYVGHPGGREEAQAVEELFSTQPEDRLRILRIGNPLVDDSPFLLVGEKIGEK